MNDGYSCASPDTLAIVGMAFKMPQEATNESNFWSIIEHRKNLMTEWPRSRINLDAFYERGIEQKPNMLRGSGAHFTKDDPGVFDASFFSISPREAEAMDPQQRWALETAYHTFENAGLPVENIRGSRTAVYASSFSDDYQAMVSSRDPDTAPRQTVTGIASSILANRISWYFNLKGPSVHLDSACSSGVVALDMACQAIRSGDATAALVFGVNVLLNPELTLLMSNINTLSPDSLCYSFDSRANGYARGEGIVALYIKPLRDAIRDGDMIRAVIRATASNQDGRTLSMTQPSAEAQGSLIRHVYRKAGLGLDQTRYLEAHGTGTPVGDPIEIKAIGSVFRKLRSPQEPLYVGSVKANIGHLEAASGLASVAKSVLVLEKGLIPPNALFERLHPEIDGTFYNIEIPTKCIPWPTSGVRRASINSFGFGGTNSHVILDDAFSYMQSHNLRSNNHNVTLPDGSSKQSSDTQDSRASGKLHLPKLLLFSAADKATLQRMTDTYQTYYREQIASDSEKLDKLAYTLAVRRSQLLWRTYAVVVPSSSSVTENEPILHAMAESTQSSPEKPGLAFIFTGQGAQYSRMGLELLNYPAFEESIMKSDQVLANVGCKWSAIDKLQNSQASESPEFSQPLCTILQIALVDLLRTMNVTPVAVVGYSSGEIAAAYAIGALSQDSACQIAYFRGQVADKLRVASENRPGAMISANIAETQVPAVLETLGMEKGALHIACVNSPINVTLSGRQCNIDRLERYLNEQGIFAQKINTAVAYHSPAMQDVSADYLHSLESTNISSGEVQPIPMISSVTCQIATLEALSTAQYWVDNLILPVRFAQAVQQLSDGAFGVHLAPGSGTITDLVEIGPHAALRRPLKDTVPLLRYHSIIERQKSPVKTLLRTLGELFCLGYPTSTLEGNQQKRGALPYLVDCPPYPFDHSRTYWTESRLSRDWRLGLRSRGYLLGKRAHDWNPLQPRWRNWLCKEVTPWLGDHVITDTIICPGSGMLVMATEAVIQSIEVQSRRAAGLIFRDVEFKSPIIIGTTLREVTETMVVLLPYQSALQKQASRSEVRIFGHTGGNWSECFHAHVEIEYDDKSTSDLDITDEAQCEKARLRDSVKKVMKSCTKAIDPSSFYDFCEKHGFHYGPSFRHLHDIRWDGNNASCARIDMGAAKELLGTANSPVHPAILDSVLHTSISIVSNGLSERIGTFVPQRFSNMWISIAAWNEATSMVRLTTSRNEEHSRSLDIHAIADDGSPLCVIKDLTVAEVSDVNMLQDSYEDGPLLHSITWKPQLSSLSPSELLELCPVKTSIGVTSAQEQYVQKVESAARIVACRAAKEFSGDSRTVASKHIQKLLSFFDNLNLQEDNTAKNTSDLELNCLLDECRADFPETRLLPMMAQALPSIIRGETDPLPLFFNNNAAESFYNHIFSRYTDAGQLENFLRLLSHENPGLRILEVGAGTGSVTRVMLHGLDAFERSTGQTSFSEYVYTDISPVFLEGAREEFANFGSRMIYKVMDLETDPAVQGFDLERYDLIVAGSVLHICADLKAGLQKVRRLLKPNGYLAMIESTKPNTVCINVAFGVLEGWWSASEKWRQHGPLITERQWDTLLRETGFSGIKATFRDTGSEEVSFTSLMISEASKTTSEIANSEDEVVLLINPLSNVQRSLAAGIAKHSSQTRIVELGAMEEKDYSLLSACVMVSLLEIGETFLSSLDEQGFDILRAHLSAAQNVLWVTSSPNRSELSTNPHLALSTGFLRAIRSEQAYKHIVTLAIEPCTYGSELHYIMKILQKCFWDTSKCSELEFIVRGGMLMIGRLGHELDLDTARTSRIHPKLEYQSWGSHPPVALQIGKQGMLDTFRFADDSLGDVNPDEVEIEASVWPISFRDVFIAMGRLEGEQLGFECAGIVSRAGVASSYLQTGDRVLAISPGCMRSHPRVPTKNIFKIPDQLSFNDAVAAMNPGMTAYHALVNVARLQAGEKILIHSAAGSTGQMAVKIAKSLGGEVFATVGSEEKRKLVTDPNGLGIAESHVFSSRNTSFVRGIKRVTGGYGVDVVLNSLSGDYLQASWECIAPYGRFVEIGKADIQANSSLPMAGFAKNASFAAIDLHHIVQTNNKLTRLLVQQVLSLLVDKEISGPSPLHLYPVSEVETAFRYMQSGKNSGRIIVTLGHDDLVPKYLVKKDKWRFDSNATYVVAGGLGGLGRTIIRWMAERGARNLLVPSRSGVSTPAASEVVADLNRRGVKVIAPSCDVSSALEFERLLNDHADMPPIKGCINASMVLQDAIYENMTFAQWSCTIKSKVDSSWNLHSLLPRDLDFFILLSSLAGIYGSTSQCNYAAGNTFQDALARARTTSGFSGSSVALDLGWMQNVGIIAERNEYRHHRERVGDMGSVYAADLLALLDHFCSPWQSQPSSGDGSQLLVGTLTPQHYYRRGKEPWDWLRRPLFAGFDVVQPQAIVSLQGNGTMQQDFSALFQQENDPKERCDIVVRAMAFKLARTLGLEVGDIDPHKSLAEYGVDSLMAVELRNWLRQDFSVTLAVFEILGGMTIRAIGELVMEKVK